MRTHTSKLALTLVAAFTLIFSSCDEKRISYSDMIKRENKEINAYMNQNNIKTIGSFPKGLVTPEGVYVKVVEGVYMRVIDAGKEPLAESGKTKVSARFKVTTVPNDRVDHSYDSYTSASGGTDPLRFIYQSKRENLVGDPRASEAELLNIRYLCAAMNESLKYVGDGALVSLIVSFREGPTFTAEKGVAMHFETIHYTFVK